MLKIPHELLQSALKSEVAIKENFYRSHHPCSMSFKTAFFFLQCYPEIFQISPSTLAQSCTKPLSTIQHSPLWLSKCTTWNNLKKKKKGTDIDRK